MRDCTEVEVPFHVSFGETREERHEVREFFKEGTLPRFQNLLARAELKLPLWWQAGEFIL